MYQADAKQDQFVDLILKNKKNGTYLDIGSCHPIWANNTFFFSNYRDWRGVCIELDSRYNSIYPCRNNCVYINDDATILDYKKIIKENDLLHIDYLSIDVDTRSLEVLEILPFNDFTCSVITIEHDAYLYGNRFRMHQREILNKAGYVTVFANVFVEQNGYADGLAFEDWYVNRNLFSSDKIFELMKCDLSPSLIIENIKNLI